MAATVWKGYLSFGLVSLPVRLASAARAESVHFHLLHKKDHSRVKEVWYCATEDNRIERSEIVKGYELSKDEYVVVEDEELKKVAPATSTTMEILQFVKSSEVDPIWFESSYYLLAEEKVSKPYSLILEAMEQTKYYAVAKMSMHSREHVVIIRPAEGGMVLHTMYYSNELHAAHKAKAPKANVTAKELDLAKTLVSQLVGPFKPSEFHDSYRENVEQMIEQKKSGQKVTAVKQPRRAPVIDLAEALKRSLNARGPAKKKARRRAA